MNQAELFRSLHQQERPLLLGNAWDVTSPQAYQEAGFQAVATSSAALANILGYEDGEKIPFHLLHDMVLRMKQKITVPFSVDLERGYGRNEQQIVRNVEQLVEAGIAGINLEDGVSRQEKLLFPIADFQRVISAVAERLNKNGLSIFINARTDAYLFKVERPLEESMKRVKAFEEAGANGVFVPLLAAEDEIRAVVDSTTLPLNVLAWSTLPNFARLAELGVKRVSLGSTVFRQLQKQMTARINEIKNSGSVSSLF